MSSQQADILTSELEYYRRILNSAITKICDTYFKLNAVNTRFEIVWDNINLQDEVHTFLLQLNYITTYQKMLQCLLEPINLKYM